ncbi:hypothetical protein GIB67_003704 [Kingdonia uniflora]|uniref:Serine-threonine/tyrosine-protein kinase catalytic domain-containing protein n=1 Tax=Kingdonia uniflora TaxID=39325 RepID=A0A7J7M3Y2_9MAGN|nr:hypothetical protein GIB67_003704 [Kingdonia uniflora]
MGHNTDLGTTNLCSFFDDDMYRITDDFSEKNLLGIGDGWELHREKMACDSNGGNVMKVTVKTWFSPDDVAVSYYEDDLRFLTCPSICSHPNIAKLYGHCCEKELLSLVYKLDPLNTLDYQLHEEEEDFALIMRVKVALGIADVVTFLHNQASPLDPARIVLDRELKLFKVENIEDATVKAIAIEGKYLKSDKKDDKSKSGYKSTWKFDQKAESKGEGSSFKGTICSHCKANGHNFDRCWKLHPELRLKEEKGNK